MAVTCDYCGAEIEDPGEGFVQHVLQNPECREQWEDEADTLVDEWSKR